MSFENLVLDHLEQAPSASHQVSSDSAELHSLGYPLDQGGGEPMRVRCGLDTGGVWLFVLLSAVSLVMVPALAGQESSGGLKEWFNPKKLSEVVARVQELAWSWTFFEDGEEETMDVSYRLLGYETVLGRKAVLVELTINEDLMLIWLDSEGNIVQGAIDGELLPPLFAEMTLGATLSFIFSPFIFAEPYKVPEALVETPLGMEIHVRDQDLRRIGDLVVPVQVVEMRVFGESYLKTRGASDFRVGGRRFRGFPDARAMGGVGCPG